MDVFALRDRLVADYEEFTRSFINVRDPRIDEVVDRELDEGLLWPESLIQLNPSFAPGASIDELAAEGVLHDANRAIFRRNKTEGAGGGAGGIDLRLHRHQEDAIRVATTGANYVLTTGTGSGKSLTYIVPIVDRILREGSGKGIRAIVIYPMNALANSQAGELEKFLKFGFPNNAGPVTYRRYTGQEKEAERAEIIASPPDILLTNYVMLELLLTRPFEKGLVEAAKDLRFLVLDELHTYRGRQGADVALLVRRVREATKATALQVVGTSATLAGGGTVDEAKVEIAAVASRLFGAPVAAENVVGETLVRSTAPERPADADWVISLRTRVESTAPPPSDPGAFVADPLASWIEGTLGLTDEPGTGRLVRARPRSIGGDQGAAAALSELTGIPVDACAAAIRETLFAGYRVTLPGSAFPVFAFRLHQFFSRGDTVFAGLEVETDRHLTTQGQQFVPGDRDRVLLPLSFCRECGQDYYTVSRRKDLSGIYTYEPRELSDVAAVEDRDRGFLYVGTENPWPDFVDGESGRVPDDWLEEKSDGHMAVKSDRRKDLPSIVHVGLDGRESPGGLRLAWVPAPFKFCLVCGVEYSGRQTRDLGKLSTLGSGGRSSATSLLSLTAVRSLRHDETLEPRARKLLAFTDNRQDASLQAGHLNDTVEVGLLRSALYRATMGAGPAGLGHDELAGKVADALGLDIADYAIDPAVKFAARAQTDAALRDVLGYRLYRDLERGWRVTAPNLEQSGLLEIHYESLDDLSLADEEWASAHHALANATPEQRRHVGKTLLDHLRRELAVHVDYLRPDWQEGMKRRSKERLVLPWAIDEDEPVEFAKVAYPRGRKKAIPDYGGNVYLSPLGGLGQFLARPGVLADTGKRLDAEDRELVIRQVCEILKVAGLLLVVDAPKEAGASPGYQLASASMRWHAGEGTAAFHDPIRVPKAPDAGLGVNPYFVRFYRDVAGDGIGIRAKEHTAQVGSEEREEREEAFREARLPILYCSPTMELGVDISELNVVGLRNVPPTPANYAQRSGRAGRSGQPALVFSYCSAGSPHDAYFFRRPDRMVAGQVRPPRLELANEDLVRSHVHAIWLRAVDKSLGRSLSELLDVSGDEPTLELAPEVKDAINFDGAKVVARAAATRFLGSVDLSEADWYTDHWLDDPLGNQTANTWNPNSTLASSTRNGARTNYTYSADGSDLLTEMADAAGTPITTKYDYNASHDVIKTYLAYGSPDEVDTVYGYDSLGTGGSPGHLASVTQNWGGTQAATTTYAYNTNDQLLGAKDALGVSTTYGYAGVNQVRSVANCIDTVAPANWYDCTGTAPHTATDNITNTATFSLPGSIKLGLPDMSSDANGRQTTSVYDVLGRLTSDTTPEGQTTSEWDQLGNEVRTTAPGSRVTTRTFDLDNRVTMLVDPGLTTTMTFDAAGSMVSKTVAGETTTSSYDVAGNVIAQTIDPGTSPHLNLTTEYAYDAEGREVAARRPAPTLNQADPKTITRTWYDAEGRVTKVVENCTTTTTTIPDVGWQSCAGTGTKDATWNLTTTTTYDDRGNKLSETAPNGRVTTYAYDALDRLTKAVENDKASPVGPTEDVTTEYAYDATGNQTAVKSPTNSGGSTVTRTFYDGLGRRTSTIANCTDSGASPPAWPSCGGTGTADASTNIVTTYAYDAVGNQVSVTRPDPSATSGTATKVTRNAYDTAGRLCRVLENASVDLQALADPCQTAVSGTATSDVSTRYTYDTIGNLATMVDGAGHTTSYGYDAKRRMTSILDGRQVQPALAWSFDDVANVKTQINRTDATPLSPTITWAYDAAGRASVRTYLDEAGISRTTTYSYDNASNLKSATDSATGATISIVSDRLRRPLNVSVSNDAGATTAYGYSFNAPTRTDASGAYTMIIDPFGRVTAMTDPIHGTPFTWAYGADGQPMAATAPNANNTVFTYDALGRITRKQTGARADYKYAYNRAGQRLTEESVITGDALNGIANFAYDKLGRLTSYGLGANTRASTWQAVPNRDSLASNGGAPVTQSFDNANRPNANGYASDADGRLTNRPGASGGYLEWDSLGRLIRVRASQGGAIVAQYTYDALDRLRTVERSGARIRFRYQGASTAVAQVVDDIGGAVLRNVAVAPDGTTLEDWLAASRRIYGTNGHHDTTWTADDTGAVTATLRYDPWGNLLGSTGTLPDWRYQGSWFDTATNLSWAVARWYDPMLGSFVSEDTLLGDAAAPMSRHLYAYSAGDPINNWDPNGRAHYYTTFDDRARFATGQSASFSSSGGVWTFDTHTEGRADSRIAVALYSRPHVFSEKYTNWEVTVEAQRLLLMGDSTTAFGYWGMDAKITVDAYLRRKGTVGAKWIAGREVFSDWISGAGMLWENLDWGDFFRIGRPWSSSFKVYGFQPWNRYAPYNRSVIINEGDTLSFQSKISLKSYSAGGVSTDAHMEVGGFRIVVRKF